LDGSGQQACYDEDGQLLNFVEGGGTRHKSHYKGHEPTGKKYFFSHHADDRMPFVHCCKWSLNLCNQMFAAARPSTDCSDFVSPGFGM